MFDTFVNVIIPAIGRFFSGLSYLATMRFSEFVSYLTAPSSHSEFIVNFMNGETFEFSFGSVRAIIADATNHNAIITTIASILTAPLTIAEFIFSHIFGGLVTAFGFGDMQTWIAFLLFAGSSFIPLICFKVIRKIFW